MVSGTPFIVKDGTKLQDIQNFIRENRGESKKLFAETVNGQQVLYLKSRVGFIDTLFGNAKKQDAARAILRTAVDNTLKDPDLARNPKAGSQLHALADHISAQRFAAGGGSVSASHVSRLVANADTIVKRLAEMPMPAENGGRSHDKAFVNLASLGDDFVGGALKTAGEELENLGTTATMDQKEAVADKLGTAMAAAYRANKENEKTDQTGAAFALSTGETMKAELRNRLGDKGSAEIVDVIVSRAFDVAASKVGPNQAHPSGTATVTRKGEQKVLADLVVGNIRYSAEKYIASGGFGDVYVFKQVKDDGSPSDAAEPHRIAVKIATADKQVDLVRQRQEALDEFELHSAASHDNNPYIMGDPGAIRMPDGSVALTMEYLPNGDVHSFGEALNAALDGEVITKAEAKMVGLTLAQDMARGLGNLNESRGMMHRDFKGPNCTISTGGVAKIIDFGTASTSTKTTWTSIHKAVGNPVWKAPEQLKDESFFSTLGDAEAKLRKANADAEQKLLGSAFKAMGLDPSKSANKAFLSQMCGHVAEARLPQDEFKNGVTVDSKADVWALGITCYKLFGGSEPAGDLTDGAVDDERIAWSQRGAPAIDPETGKGGSPTNGCILGSTGHTDVDAFLNGILAGKPGQRPNGGKIADNPIFTETAGVGSQGARDLIKALAMPDAKDIARKIEELDPRITYLEDVVKSWKDKLDKAQQGASDYNNIQLGYGSKVEELNDARARRESLAAKLSGIDPDVRPAAIKAASDRIALELRKE